MPCRGSRRVVGARVERDALRGEEGVQRPPAVAGHGLHGVHVDRVDVRALLAVDLDAARSARSSARRPAGPRRTRAPSRGTSGTRRSRWRRGSACSRRARAPAPPPPRDASRPGSPRAGGGRARSRSRAGWPSVRVPFHVPSSRNRDRGRRPRGRGPYSHAVKSGGSSSVRAGPARPRHRQPRGGRRRRAGVALPGQPGRGRGRGGRLARRRRALRHLPHRHGDFARSTRSTAGTSRASPPARTTIGVAALPLGARGRDRRDPRPAGLMGVTSHDIQAARAAVERIARRTPVVSTRTISERDGRRRRAQGGEPPAHRLLQGPRRVGQARGARRGGCAHGVVCASAGNHAQGVAAAAAARGVPCDVFVPTDASIAKTEATPARARRCTRRRIASTSASPWRTRARGERGLAFVHPYDDPDIIAGPGDARARARRGRARAGQRGHPDRRRRAGRRHRDRGQGRAPGGRGGRRAGRGCAPYPESLRAAARPATSALTIADGIAVKGPGESPSR